MANIITRNSGIVGDVERIVAANAGIENVIHVNVSFNNSMSYFNPATFDADSRWIESAEIRYLTSDAIFDREYIEFRGVEYFEGELIRVDDKFYEISKDSFAEVLNSVKEDVIAKWSDLSEEDRMKLAEKFVDAPVSIELVEDKFRITYNPVSSREGDGLRGGDNIRSNVETHVTKECEEKIDAFLFNDELQAKFSETATVVGEVREEEIQFAKDDQINDLFREYAEGAKIKEMEKEVEFITTKFRRGEAAIKDAAKLLKRVEAGVDADSDVLNWAKDVMNSKCCLSKDLYLVKADRYYESSEIPVECFNEEFDSIVELPDTVLNQYGIINKILDGSGIKLGENVIIEDHKVSSNLKDLIIAKGDKVYEYDIARRNTLLVIVFDSKNPNFRNKTGFGVGRLIGKGGAVAKEIAGISGLRYIKYID